MNVEELNKALDNLSVSEILNLTAIKNKIIDARLFIVNALPEHIKQTKDDAKLWNVSIEYRAENEYVVSFFGRVYTKDLETYREYYTEGKPPAVRFPLDEAFSLAYMVANVITNGGMTASEYVSWCERHKEKGI
jgi:hypothetical protein